MARMTKADWQLVWEAVNHAITERDSFRDAMRGEGNECQEQIDRCDRFIERAEAFCQKHFGQQSAVSAENARYAAAPNISIFELHALPASNTGE